MSPVDSAPDMTRLPDEPMPDDSRPSIADRGLIDRRADSSPPDNLRQRMDQLPPGHPSSPYEADGSPRQPSPRLRELDLADDADDTGRVDSEPIDSNRDADELADFETPDTNSGTDHHPDRQPPDAEPPTDTERAADQIRPLTDAEWAEHVTEVHDCLDKADAKGLATDRLYTTDPDREQWTPARDRIQGDLVADLYERSSHVPCERRAIVAGGLGGAGKSTVLGKYAGIDLSEYLTINPDKVKEKMASRGLIPEVDGLSPMEASDLVHEESSAVAKQLAHKALSEGKNVIWDITMSSRASTERRIDDLRAAGYTVEGIFVDIPVETSVRRADARHREGHDDYRAGIGLGGRYVPPEVVRAQFDPDWGSQNRKTFENVNQRFDRWTRYDNSVDDQPPLLVETTTPDEKNREEKA